MECEVKCGTCVFFIGNKDKHQSEGACIRFPPTVFPIPTQTVVGAAPKMMYLNCRPTVTEDSLCGEYKSIPEPQSNQPLN